MRKFLWKVASEEPKEPLLTGQPSEGEASRREDATCSLPSPVSPVSPGPLAWIPIVPAPRGGRRTLTVRNPSEGRRRDSQETLTTDAQQQANTSSRPTVGRFAFETSEAGSDDITPAPPHNREETRASVASTADANIDSRGRPFSCYICGKFFGEKEPHTDEKVAYLPCGHAFGHECLFTWLSRANGLRRCPILPCSPTLHQCEHITVPKTVHPGKTFEDHLATVLPWDYEFCSSPKGVKLQKFIKETGANVRGMDAEKSRGESSAMGFIFEGRRRLYTHQVQEAERSLEELHRNWWAAQREGFGQEKKKRFWQRTRGEDQAGSSSTSA